MFAIVAGKSEGQRTRNCRGAPSGQIAHQAAASVRARWPTLARAFSEAEIVRSPHAPVASDPWWPTRTAVPAVGRRDQGRHRRATAQFAAGCLSDERWKRRLERREAFPGHAGVASKATHLLSCEQNDVERVQSRPRSRAYITACVRSRRPRRLKILDR